MLCLVLCLLLCFTWSLVYLCNERAPILPNDVFGMGPNASNEKLVYTMLLSGWEGSQTGLQDTLLLVQKHLLPWNPGDVLLFHTGAYETEEQQAAVRGVIPSAEFAKVPREAWSLPPGLKEDDLATWAFAPCCPEHDIGYRHMCRWYSNRLFKYLANLGYTWVLRLDEDSKVLSPARANLVSWMKANGKRYGYRLIDEDDTEIIWALPEFTSFYLTSRYLQPAYLLDSCRPQSLAGLNSQGGWDRRVIYNNFFLVDIKWWLTEPVQAYLEALEKTNGNYLFRWGDAAIHTMVVKTFLSRSQTHMFGFAYRHKDNSDIFEDAGLLLCRMHHPSSGS